MRIIEVDRALLLGWPLPEISDSDDKEDRGSLLVVAGSREMPGAALLAAEAAFRAGAGKVTVATARSVAVAVAMAIPEARVIALPETLEGGFDEAGLPLIEGAAAKCSAALIGPGMLDAAATTRFAQRVLDRLKRVPVLLDALGMEVSVGKQFEQNILMTPHAGEMAHLAGCSKGEVSTESAIWARRLSDRCRSTVALKGAETWIAGTSERMWRHIAQVPGLGISGSGDVLAGIMGGLLARGASAEQAAVWAVFLHSQAGHALGKRIGPVGFLARELAASVPALLGSL